MICNPCKLDSHEMCPSSTWCDCQHEARKKADNDAGAGAADPTAESVTTSGAGTVEQPASLADASTASVDAC